MNAYGNASRWSLCLSLALCAASACKANKTGPDLGPDAVGPPSPPGEPTVYETVPARIQRELDTAAKLDPDKATRMKVVRPILSCVEQLSAKDWRAHFGYTNATSNDVLVPVGFYNRFWPPPIGQGQPTVLVPGTKADVVRIAFNGMSSAAWILGAAFQLADSTSPRCPGTGAPVASAPAAGAPAAGTPVASVPAAGAPAAATPAAGAPALAVGTKVPRRHRPARKHRPE